MFERAKEKQSSGGTIMAALLALRAGDYDTAAEAASYLRKLQPDGAETWTVTLRVALARADLELARKAADKAYSLGGAKAVGMGLNGAVDPWFAYPLVMRLAKEHPQDEGMQLLLARSAQAAGDPGAALAAAQAASDFGPGALAAQFIAIQALWDLGRRHDALTQAAKALSDHGHDIGLRLFYANMLAQENERHRAHEVLGDARALSGDNPQVDFGYAMVAATLGDEAKARTRLTKMLAQGDQRAAVYNLLGALAGDRDQWGEAFGWYQQIHSPDQLASSRVASLFALNHWKGMDVALRYLAQLKKHIPGLAPTWAEAHASLLGLNGKDEAAWQLLGKVLERYPDVRPLRFHRAMLAGELGKTDASLKALKRLVAEAPNNPLYLNAYGYTLAEHTTRYREARGYIKQALAIMPNDGAILDSMGWVLYKMKRPEEALPYLHRAWKQTGDIKVAQHLVRVYMALDRRGEAQKVLTVALHKSPKDPQLLQLKHRLSRQ